MVIFLNAISMIVFRNGIVQSAVGASVSRSCWILGSKNNVVYSIPVILLFLSYESMQNEKGKRKLLFWILLLLLSVSFMGSKGVQFGQGSSTAILMMIIFLLCFLLFWIDKYDSLYRFINIRTIAILSIFVMFLLAWACSNMYDNGLLGKLTDILGKDITFSGRSTVWSSCLKQFISNPIYGSGEAGNYYLYNSMYMKTSNEYSFWLYILVRYGMIGLCFFGLVVLCSDKNIYRDLSYYCRVLFMIIMISGLVDIPNFEAIELVLIFSIGQMPRKCVEWRNGCYYSERKPCEYSRTE